MSYLCTAYIFSMWTNLADVHPSSFSCFPTLAMAYEKGVYTLVDNYSCFVYRKKNYICFLG